MGIADMNQCIEAMQFRIHNEIFINRRDAKVFKAQQREGRVYTLTWTGESDITKSQGSGPLTQ